MKEVLRTAVPSLNCPEFVTEDQWSEMLQDWSLSCLNQDQEAFERFLDRWECRLGDGSLTVDEDNDSEVSHAAASWETFELPDEDLDLDDLELDPCGHSLKWKDTLD